MSHEAVHTDRAPAAIGPYSQAVAFDTGHGKLLFVSGQIPLDAETGQLVEGPISGQTEAVMRNLGAVLEEAGSGFERLLKVTIYLADMDDFAAVNEVYGRFVVDPLPARATVEVSRLPRNVGVEIDAIARA